jgi:hypothetical protein
LPGERSVLPASGQAHPARSTMMAKMRLTLHFPLYAIARSGEPDAPTGLTRFQGFYSWQFQASGSVSRCLPFFSTPGRAASFAEAHASVLNCDCIRIPDALELHQFLQVVWGAGVGFVSFDPSAPDLQGAPAVPIQAVVAMVATST